MEAFTAATAAVDRFDAHVVAFAASIGFPADQMRYVGSILFCYVLALVYRLLPNQPTLKHAYNTFWGVTLGLYIWGWAGMIHSLITMVVTYVLCAATPRPQVWVPVFVMGYMSAAHIYRMSVDYMGWSLDFTTPQMLVTVKLWSFAFNVADGRNLQACDGEQRRYSVARMPGLAEWFGYIYYFGGFLAGPLFEFTEYVAFVDMSLFNRKALNNADDVTVWFETQEEEFAGYRKAFAAHTSGATLRRLDRDEIAKLGIPANHAAALARKFAQIPLTTEPVSSTPNGFLPALAKFAGALAAMVGVLFAPNFPVAYMGTAAFRESGFLAKVWYELAAITFFRMKYYFGWLLAEGAANVSGMGFGGYYYDASSGVEKTRWDAVTAVYPFSVEFATSIREAMTNWNMGVANRWLRRYVYQRLWTSKGSAPFHITMATYLVSAFWHGFYPGYYLTFATGALMNEVARNLRRAFHDRVKGTVVKPLYDIVGYALTTVTMTYLATPFALLDGVQGFQAWQSQYFYLHIGALAAFFVLPLVTPRAPKSKAEAGEGKDKKAASSATTVTPVAAAADATTAVPRKSSTKARKDD